MKCQRHLLDLVGPKLCVLQGAMQGSMGWNDGSNPDDQCLVVCSLQGGNAFAACLHYAKVLNLSAAEGLQPHFLQAFDYMRHKACSLSQLSLSALCISDYSDQAQILHFALELEQV